MNNLTGTEKKEYLISLNRRQSILALVAGVTILSMIFVIIVLMAAEFILLYPDEYVFQYFTQLSNLLAAIGAAFMIPYAVEGIRKKLFTLPHWVVLFQYSGTVCVAITMISYLLIILPYQGLSDMLIIKKLLLHTVTPLLTILLFQCVESNVLLSRKDMFIALIPFWTYVAIYFVMVILIGQENGGWKDVYHVKDVLPIPVVFVLVMIIGFAVAFTLRKIQALRVKKLKEKISRHWKDDLSPIELKIEAFGLGHYMGTHCDINDLTIPVEIFSMMVSRYDVTMEELITAYNKGLLDVLTEKYTSSTK